MTGAVGPTARRVHQASHRRRETERPALLRLALLAAALLIVYGLLAPHLPRLSLRPGMVVALAVNLTLFALLCVGLLPLRGAGGSGLLLGLAGAAAGALFTALGWAAAADVGKILFAAALGFWLAEQIESVGIVVLIAALSVVVDIVSVFWGPTRAILEHAPASLGYFTVALGWPGYDPSRVFTALGVSDLIFFCLYLGAARRFRLRAAATVVGMCLSVVVSVVVGLRISAVPALPLLAVALVGVNADLLLRRRAAGRARGGRA